MPVMLIDGVKPVWLIVIPVVRVATAPTNDATSIMIRLTVTTSPRTVEDRPTLRLTGAANVNT